LLRTIPLIGSSLYLIVVGGDQPGPSTLVRFYAWHIFGLTIIFSFFTIWHLFRVRRDGGIATPPPHQRRNNSRITRYELARREFLTVIVGSAILLAFANLLPAPISPPLSDSNITTEIARAPWFFLWIQQLLKYGNPFLLGICVPTVVLLIFSTLPYLFPLPLPEELGSWFPKHNRLAQLCVFGLLIIICTLAILAIQPSPP
jgi:quinol-cytochrome oxidoreductase complex cytochrome b subunit